MEYITSKKDTNGNGVDSYTHLWEAGDTADVFEIMAECERIKEKRDIELFNHEVFFDEKKNAGFSIHPTNAFYGMEPEKQKHIKAIYSFCIKNGFSELTIYDSNMLYGKPTIIKI